MFFLLFYDRLKTSFFSSLTQSQTGVPHSDSSSYKGRLTPPYSLDLLGDWQQDWSFNTISPPFLRG